MVGAATTSIFPRVSREPPRFAFVAAILVGHGLLIYLLLDRSGIFRRETQDAELWNRVYIASIPSLTERAKSQEMATAASATRRPERDTAPIDLEPLAREEVSPVPDGLPPSDSAPSIDWKQEATGAARRSVELGTKAREFSDLTRDDSVLRKKIEEAPKVSRGHRAGDIEMVGPGIERRWVSEKCYWEFGTPPPLFAGQGPMTNPLHCMIGSVEPNSHLFDEIKPKYLREKH